MRTSLRSALAVATLVAACSGTTPTESSATLPVIRAYLYAGAPVDAVQISTTFAVGSSDTVGTPVNDASVTLVRRGKRFTLTKAAGDSGYYRYAGSDLDVAVNDTFDLEVVARGKSATARTIVPSPAASLTLSSTTLTIPDFSSGGPGAGFDPSQLTLVARWPNANKDAYYIVTENIETNPKSVSNSGFVPRFRFVSAPTTADSGVVVAFSLTQYGRHRLTLYRVTSAYAALYESRTQDSRDLNEPASNIVGGLGIFAAFSSRSADFVAK
jgi:hypothetical protein